MKVRAATPGEAASASAVPGAFLRLLAHELRNYIAPIQNATHLLRLRARNDPALAPVADIIERQATGMLRTLESIAEADRAARGELELQRAPVPASALLQRAVEAVQPLCAQRRVELVVAEGAELPEIEVDSARVVRALTAVLDNAARYAPEQTRVEVEVRRTAGAIEFEVRDEGPGIDDPVPALFAAIHRAGHGLGLGLPLAQTVAALHGGELSIERRRGGRGTAVTIALPLAAAAARATTGGDAAQGQPMAGAEAGSGSSGRRVLIADDSAAIRASLGDLLQDLGHEVRAAADGAEALALAQSWMPEFVLLDIHMPKLNGFEAARKLRALFPSSTMQLVLISGDDLDETMRRGAREAGFDHCVDKGLAIGELTALLARGGGAPASPSGQAGRNPL